MFKRLGFISTFEGGNSEIIEYGMNLLALIMIEGYHRSEEKDKQNGTYNPFVSGTWDYEKTKFSIISKIGVSKNHQSNTFNIDIDTPWI